MTIDVKPRRSSQRRYSEEVKQRAVRMVFQLREETGEKHGTVKRVADQLKGLRCHSDAGSQFTSVRYGERLAELGAVPSIGSVGDSFDNALAESVIGLYKAKLIRGPDRGPWRTIEDVELATLAWVHWWNSDRIHGYLDDTTPDEFEAAYAASPTDQPLVGIQ